MALSNAPLDDNAIRDRLTHHPGYAVLCQSPESGYTVVEFVAIVTPDCDDAFDANESQTLFAIRDLYGVVRIAEVVEHDVGMFAVDREIGTKRLPLWDLDDDLAGPATPQGSNRLWTAGSADYYPMYELERTGDERFEIDDATDARSC